MTEALVFLITRSWRNATIAKLRRLRQPRYALITIVGLLYFGQMFLQSGRGWQAMGMTATAVLVCGPMLLLLMLTRPWWWPGGGRGGLGFSNADVHLLFPAPVSRRQLAAYRLAQSQGGLVVGALIFTAVTQPPLDATLFFRFLGIWCLSGIVSAHAMVVTMSRTGVVPGDAGSMARRWIPALLLLLAVANVIVAIIAGWPSLSSASRATVIDRLGAIVGSGAAGLVFWPMRVLFEVPAASTFGEFVSALPIAVGLWGAMIFWVLRTDAAFEETAAEQAEKLAQVMNRKTLTAPTRARRTMFVLRPLGRVEVAFFWKNLIAAGQMSKLLIFFAMSWTVPVVVMFVATEGTAELSGLLAILCLGLAAMMTLTGAMQLTCDLRQDLSSLALIKSWPVSGAAIVRGEVLAPAVLLSAVVTMLITLGTALGIRIAVAEWNLTWMTLVQWAIAAMCLSTGVIVIQVVVQNGIAVMFPAWIRIGPKAAVGADAMGQQLVMMLGSFLMLPILAIPAVMVGGITLLVTRWSLGSAHVLIPAVVTTGCLLIEALVATQFLGRILDRTDISAVGP